MIILGFFGSWFKNELICISTKLLCLLANEQLRKDALNWTSEGNGFRLTWNKPTFHFQLFCLSLSKEKVVQSVRTEHTLLVFFFLKHLETNTSFRIVVIYTDIFLPVLFFSLSSVSKILCRFWKGAANSEVPTWFPVTPATPKSDVMV